MPTPPSAPQPRRTAATDRPPTRRQAVRLAVRLAVLGGAAVTVSACSAEQREALADVDPREVRLDRADAVVERPRPSEREQRRRAVLAGAVAARRAYADAGADVAPLLGRYGGTAAPAAAVAVHAAHLELLSGGRPAGTRSGRLGAVAEDAGGPVLPPAARPAAVLGAGAVTALRAAAAERDAEDADTALAALHARVAAARDAQAAALAGRGVTGLPWPTAPADGAVVQALQGVLAAEQRARWSYGVVLAWSTDRAADAATARGDHDRRAEVLRALLGRLGVVPVAPGATYPTDDDGRPVDGPVTAAALALRVEDAVSGAAGALLGATLTSGDVTWLPGAVAWLAEAERARWSWGGAPQPLPGG